MITVFVATAVIALAALVVGVVTDQAVIVYVAIGMSVTGLVLMIVDARRRRQRSGGARPAAAGNDLGEGDQHAAEFFEDHSLVAREVEREEHVIHSDTGPREPDMSHEEAITTLVYDHFHGVKQRGKTPPKSKL